MKKEIKRFSGDQMQKMRSAPRMKGVVRNMGIKRQKKGRSR
jgi:hypothetical protein